MTVAQHIVLFWIFVAFFVLIGIIALLAILGIVSTDKEFRRWAVVGFAAGVSGVLFIWAKSPTPVDFTVNLRPPEDAPRNFELVRGKWEEFQPSAPEIAFPTTS